MNLYRTIIEHRRLLTPVRGISYSNHSPERINPIPPDALMGQWRRDYEFMREGMIYGPSLKYKQLIERIKELVARFRAIPQP